MRPSVQRRLLPTVFLRTLFFALAACSSDPDVSPQDDVGDSSSGTDAATDAVDTLDSDASDLADTDESDTDVADTAGPNSMELTVELCDASDACAELSGGEVVQDTVTLRAETREDDATTIGVEFFVDDALQLADTAAPWEWSWDSTASLDGDRTVRVLATSESGLTAEVVHSVRVNNCDRDEDSYLARSCGGLDCDDEDGAYVSNACGGCDALDNEVGGACGACGTGAWACTEGGDLTCEGDEGAAARNACGGCTSLTAEPDSACGPCGDDVYECSADGESVACTGATTNACGGCDALTAEPDSACGPCGDDVYECSEDGESVVCTGATTNACGGCTALAAEPDSACGLCGDGAYECSEDGESVVCSGETTNACGGCAVLAAEPDSACGPCGDDVYECSEDGESVVCSGETTNACGACTALAAEPDSACGPCGDDVYECSADGESVVCGGETTNACGGCATLSATRGDACTQDGGEAGVQVCSSAGVLDCRSAPDGFVRIDAGTFLMGSPSGEVGRSSDEAQHSVTLTRDYFIQTTEVTQGAWEALMGNQPSYYESCGDCPVERVNWWETLAYANALSRQDGLAECYTLTGCGTTAPGEDMECDSVTVNAPEGDPYQCDGYRLPTEAEWEYAARAGTTTATHLGDLLEPVGCNAQPNLAPIAWFCENAGGTTHEVATRAANPWGVYDSLGNVWEWCWDWYGGYGDTEVDPSGPSAGGSRAARGASWYDSQVPRAAIRRYVTPADGFSILGFRLVRTAP